MLLAFSVLELLILLSEETAGILCAISERRGGLVLKQSGWLLILQGAQKADLLFVLVVKVVIDDLVHYVRIDYVICLGSVGLKLMLDGLAIILKNSCATAAQVLSGRLAFAIFVFSKVLYLSRSKTSLRWAVLLRLAILASTGRYIELPVPFYFRLFG